MSIFPNLCLWRRSLHSNLGGIDLEKLYRATLKRFLCCQIKSPFLETFLKRSSAHQPPNELKILDLLWRYYEKTKNYSAAARVLSKLSEKER